MSRRAPNRRVCVGARGRGGFTLIELLVSVAIIAILMSLLLPALRGARESARGLMCQAHLKQIGVAIRGYLDVQGESSQVFLDLYPRSPTQVDRWNAMVLLGDFLDGHPEAGLFECPAAAGPTSVRDSTNRILLQRRSIFQEYDYDGDGVVEVTEYWFNDSRATTYGELFGSRARNPSKPLGVSGQDLVRIDHPEAIVWAADAIDWIPRHQGKTMFLRGDGGLSVEAMAPAEYLSVEAEGFWGEPGPFYNWGHYFPRVYGPGR